MMMMMMMMMTLAYKTNYVTVNYTSSSYTDPIALLIPMQICHLSIPRFFQVF